MDQLKEMHFNNMFIRWVVEFPATPSYQRGHQGPQDSVVFL